MRVGPAAVVWLLLTLLAVLPIAHASHYATLGVSPKATAQDIKVAYRQLALKYHPDKQREPSKIRQASERIKQINEAYEIVSDPAKRRQYDFDLANPIQKGEDGIYRQGAPGEMPARPLVEVQLDCTLEALGGWVEATVPLSAWCDALGAVVTEAVALRLGLPLRLYLPPGSRAEDLVRHTVRSLGPNGVDIDFRLVAKPHRRLVRRGDTLRATIVLPAWHNVVSPAVRFRGVDGELLTVRARRGAKTPGAGEKVKLSGQGMPVLGSSDMASLAERGDLEVEIRLRNAAEEAVYLASRAGGALGMALLCRAAALRAPGAALGAIEQLTAAAALVGDFLSMHVFGRARPEMRLARIRASDEQRTARRRQREEREAFKKRQQRRRVRTERWSCVRASYWEPLARRARAAWEWAWE